MLWFYARDEDVLHIETRYENRTAEYILVVHRSDGRPQEERFTSGSTFRDRLLELESRLAGERWASSGPPVILDHGWPDKLLR